MTRFGNRGLLVAALILAAAGAGVVGLAIASQHHAPQPPAAAAGSLGPTSPRNQGPPGIKTVGPILPRSRPMRIDIPAIGVHSQLLNLGETAGAIQVPTGPKSNYNKAGWYRYSPMPGSLGPAVILGHVDSGDWGPSVFFRLGDLRPGEKVRVTRADGIVAVFTISGVRHFQKARFPTKIVYGNTNFAALRLITCGGAFDWTTGHYLQNIVVFASLASPHGRLANA